MLAYARLMLVTTPQQSLERASEILDRASTVNRLQLETSQPCKHGQFVSTQRCLSVQAHAFSAKGSKLLECASTLNQPRCTKPRHARHRHDPAPN